MKKYELLPCAIALSIVLACGNVCAVSAQQPSPADALLVAMADTNAVNGVTALAELAALPEDELLALALRVRPWETGGDVAARTALCGLSYHVTRPGFERDRARFNRVLLRALDQAVDREVRAFFIDQLRLVRLESSVPALASRLNDPTLRDPAARALIAVETPVAKQALMRCLAESRDNDAICAVLSALKEFADVQADVFIPFAASTNGAVRMIALQGLAAVANSRAYPVLAAALDASTAQERGAAALFCAEWAARLDAQTALRMGRDVMRTGEKFGDDQVTATGLAILAAASPKTVPDELIAALGHAHRMVRGQAIRLLVSRRDERVSAALRKLVVSSQEDARFDGVEALAMRDELDAKQARTLLQDKAVTVRLAAARHLLRLEGESALDDLVPCLAGPDGDGLRDLMAAELPWKACARIAAILPSVPVDVQMRLLDVLGARRAMVAWMPVLNLTQDANDRLAKAAIKALGSMVDTNRMPELVGLFAAASDKRVADFARALVVAMAEDTSFDVAVKAADGVTGNRRKVWHQVLHKVTGDKALAVLVTDTRNEDAAVRLSAVKTLAQWGNAAQAKPVLKKISTESTDPEVRAVAATAVLDAGKPKS